MSFPFVDLEFLQTVERHVIYSDDDFERVQTPPVPILIRENRVDLRTALIPPSPTNRRFPDPSENHRNGD